MKQKSFRYYILALFLGVTVSTHSLAQEGGGEDITSLINYLQRVLNAAVENIAESIYQFNKMLPKTISTNLVETKTLDITNTYTKALAFCQVYTSLPRHNQVSSDVEIPEEFKSISTGENASTGPQGGKGKLNDFCQKLTQAIISQTEPATFKKSLSAINATDIEKPKKLGTYVQQLGGKSDPIVGNNNFNFENLFSPTIYKDLNDQKNALRFVAFSGKTYEPAPIDLDSWRIALEKYPDQLDFINFQMAFRSYIAAQSVAVSNLYQMIAERTEQPEIKKLNLKNEAGDEIKSPLQYREYLATHRVNSTDWYTMINSASSNTVSREMVYILAEIQRSLYRMEQTNERMLATLSLIELISLNANARPELKAMVPAIQALVGGKKETP